MECAAFSPKLYRKAGKSSAPPHAVIALGSQDCSLSIWDTSKATPILVMTGVADRAILSICWHPDGLTFFAASYNGSLIACRFEEGELGEALSEKAVKTLMTQQTQKEALQQKSMDELPQHPTFAANKENVPQSTAPNAPIPVINTLLARPAVDAGPRRVAPQLMTQPVSSPSKSTAVPQDRMSFMRAEPSSQFANTAFTDVSKTSVPLRALVTGGKLCAVQLGTPPIVPRGTHKIDEDLSVDYINQKSTVSFLVFIG